MLQAFLGGGGGAVAAAAGGQQAVLTVEPDETSNKLVVMTTPALFRDVEKLCQELDDAARDTSEFIQVVPVKGVNPTQVRWAVTVDDPTTWTRPWTFAMPLTVDDRPFPAYECHEGNYGLRNILSAARAEEKGK